VKPARSFRFACHRCGHCCSGGTGYVWIEAEEIAPMAARLGVSAAVFAQRYVRRAPDPRTGRLRLALREDADAGGRCVLLEGASHCRVYADRPEHCRTFPFWPSILSDDAAFERARAVCPGIAAEVDEDVRRVAFERLEALYRQVDAAAERSQSVCILRGVCCRFEEAEHRLYATALEADYAAARRPDAPPPEAPGRCPYHVAGRCTAREERPLACRTYYCDPRTRSALEATYEHFLEELRRIERELGYPPAYASFPELLAARGVGGEPPPADRGPAADEAPR